MRFPHSFFEDGRPWCWALALCAMLAMVWVPGAHAQADVYGRVIVRLKPQASVLRNSLAQPQASGDGAMVKPMHRLGAKRGLQLEDGRDLGHNMHVASARGMRSEALAAILSRDSDVVYAVPDGWRKPLSAPNDPLYAASSGNSYVTAGQWYLRAPDSVTVAAINAEGAWPVATGAGISVAVIDSGVRFDHPDLIDNLRAGYNMMSEPTMSQVDGGRSADASDLGDWVTAADLTDIRRVDADIDCKLAARSSWHGTKVAGIIGAKANNGIGMASVAPDASILPVRVLGKCGGFDSDIIAAMRWAAGQPVDGVAGASPPARVINMSLGGEDACSEAYKQVISELTALQVVIVASAGNDSGLAVSTPANCPGVIAVGALRHTGTKVGYSSVGPEIGISAPGGNCVNASGTCVYAMLTTSNTGFTTPVPDASGGSTYTDSNNDEAYGTSFSAPQVSGAVALMLQARPTLTPAAVASLLRSTARAFPTTGATTGVGACHAPNSVTQDECYCTATTCGAGMLDVASAVQAAQTRAVPVIQFSSVAPQAAQALVLSGTTSMPSPGGAGIASYHWTLLDGGGIVSAADWDASANAVTVTPTASGTFGVRLTVQDNLGQSASSDRWVVVAASASSSPSPSSNGGSGGGGGGGSADAFLLALLGSVLALAHAVRPRPCRA